MENNINESEDYSIVTSYPSLDSNKLKKILESIFVSISKIEKELLSTPELTKRSGVKEYLGISESTLSVMMRDGRLKQGTHFKKDLVGKKTKVTFFSEAIKKYKRDLGKD